MVCITMHQNASPPQAIILKRGQRYRRSRLPNADVELMPGVRWGNYEQLMTPAFWAVRAQIHQESVDAEGFRLGRTLREEVAACLLGGYGMGAELALAAFKRLQGEGVLTGTPSMRELEGLLSQPIQLSDKTVQYRFPRQKARFLSCALLVIDELAHLKGVVLRNALLEIPGIGPKTASWITRNWCGSDEVAILDVHICRACEIAGGHSRS